MTIQELWLSLIDFFGLAWWVEIVTDSPSCTYYFGPFVSADEATNHQIGYIEDLESEAAQGIQVAIGRCKPLRITIERDVMRSVSLAN